MATPPPSPSTSVEIEPPPDIATPVWPPLQPIPVLPHIPTFHFAPDQYSSPHPRSLGVIVAFEPTPMQLCTSVSGEASPP